MARQQKPAATEVEAPKTSAKSLFDRVAGYLDANDWHYSANQDKNFFDMRSRIKDASVRVIIDLFEEQDWQRILVYSVFPVFVPENRRAAALDAINRINFQMIYGNLEMDLADGEIRVRTVVESDREIGDGMVERALHSNLNTAGRYFAPILAVAFANAGPETIVDLATAREDATLQ